VENAVLSRQTRNDDADTVSPAGGRVVRGPDVPLPPDDLLTMPGRLRHMARNRADEVMLRVKRLGIYQEITWRAGIEIIARIAVNLHAQGVYKGDRVAIVGDPVPEWVFTDIAAQCIGAISYGIYPTSSREEIAFILEHGGASVVTVEDQEHVDKVLAVIDRVASLKRIYIIDDSTVFGYDHPALFRFDDLMGRRDADAILKEFWRLTAEVQPDDPATIVYTSGTSTHPKGAVYTHRALTMQGLVFFAFPELMDRLPARSVVHLPLNHLYERMNTQLGMLMGAVVPHFGEDAGRFTQTLYDVSPQYVASVPRYWSKLASTIIVGIENSSRLKRLAFETAMKFGRVYRSNGWAGQGALASGIAYWFARVFVFNRMLKKLGLNRTLMALSAGAPLPSEVQALWQIWGVNLKNMYGQTEAGVVTAQFNSFPEPGTVGRPYPLTAVSLGADGEIISQTPGCFAAYWKDADASAAMIKPEGIRTGDVGSFDEDGTLRIVDRKKDIIITAGGKNISPSLIETALKSSPYISEVSVIGEGRKYLTALVELDVGTVSEWARANSILYTSYTSLAKHPQIASLIEQEIARGNQQLGRVEQIKAFRILDRELDPEVEGEAITPTRKIKRSQLQKHFGHLIDQMYGDDETQRINKQLQH
jgi:long-chain acyl-CoA synthetase